MLLLLQGLFGVILHESIPLLFIGISYFRSEISNPYSKVNSSYNY